MKYLVNSCVSPFSVIVDLAQPSAFKETLNKPGVQIAQSDFSSDCTEFLQAY